MNRETPPIAAARYVGERVPRKEDARLLTGRGAYVDDIVLPGMLHVAFVRSPIARGRIRSIDVAAAQDLPGVYAVYTAADLSSFPAQMNVSYNPDAPAGAKIYPLSPDRVAYVGDPIAMVLAEDRYLAEDGASLVEIDIEAEADPVVTIEDARTRPPIHSELPDNVAAVFASPHEDPELESILKNAPHLVSGIFTHQRMAHSPMETRGIVAARNGVNDLLVYTGCQSTTGAARGIANAFGLQDNTVRVIAKDVGGSFGLKGNLWREEYAVVAAALSCGRPLKWIEDRIENLTAASQTREQECRLDLAFDGEGRLLGSKLDYAQNVGAYPTFPDANFAVPTFIWGAYKMPRFGFVARGYHSNTVGITAYRGPWAMESHAREVLLDIAARRIGLDPVEIRRRNLVTAADQPCVSAVGLPIEDITPDECLDLLLETVDVAGFRKEQAAARAQGRYLGLGIATYIEPTTHANFPTTKTEVAQIRIEPSGKVSANLSTHSQGHGTETTMAQVIADHVGVPFDHVAVYQDDSQSVGMGVGAGGSRQAVAGGGACIKASQLLTDKVKRIAAYVLNANVEEVRIQDGMVLVEGAAEMSRTLGEIAAIAYYQPERLPPDMEPGLQVQYRYQPPPIVYTSAAHACFVEVDIDTGFVKLTRWVCAEDCGVVIHPAVVEGQIAGGLAQGIGAVLLENFEYDAQGNPTTVTFKDYLLPSISDVPDFEYAHICTPSKSEGGFRGIGEGGAIIGPPTLVNAIADALSPFGVECLKLPLSPPRVLELLEAANAA